MLCGCGPSPQQSAIAQPVEMTCVDCGGGTDEYPLLFVIALLIVVLLRTMRRKTRILTLNLR
jgi:hypothetical protein